MVQAQVAERYKERGKVQARKLKFNFSTNLIMKRTIYVLCLYLCALKIILQLCAKYLNTSSVICLIDWPNY